MTKSAAQRVKRANNLLDKATRAHRAGNLDEAIGGYVQALEIDPENPQAFNNMGVALRAQGAFPAAVASYRCAIAISSGDPGSHSNLGNAMRALGRHPEAAASHRRALELDAEILLKATRVDGVYSEDPEKNPHAILYRHLTYNLILERNLRVMDPTAIAHCMEHKIPVLVFNYQTEGNIQRAIRGEKVGTLVSSEATEKESD